MKNSKNNEYTRCIECGYIYENSAKSCPNCGTPNGNKVCEDILDINESSEPVFNIND